MGKYGIAREHMKEKAGAFGKDSLQGKPSVRRLSGSRTGGKKECTRQKKKSLAHVLLCSITLRLNPNLRGRKMDYGRSGGFNMKEGAYEEAREKRTT